jgi:hypothetical protein
VLGRRWCGVCVGARDMVCLLEADDPPVWAPWLAPHGHWWWGAEQAAGERLEVARAQQLLGWAEGSDRERVLLVSPKCLLNAASTTVLWSRFSDGWDRAGSAEPRSRSRGSSSLASRALASAFLEKRSRDATDADDRDVAFAMPRDLGRSKQLRSSSALVLVPGPARPSSANARGC